MTTIMCAGGTGGMMNMIRPSVALFPILMLFLSKRKEKAAIFYTGDSSFTCSDKTTAKAVATRTYEAAVELFAMLCKQYNLNPTADGVIISHKEGRSRGIASNHGDPEHL